MKKELRGTKTEQNLINAFAGESMARNRYTFFAKIAKEEGYEQISEIFCMTAENEKEHAEIFYEHIGDTFGHVDAVSNSALLKKILKVQSLENTKNGPFFTKKLNRPHEKKDSKK